MEKLLIVGIFLIVVAICSAFPDRMDNDVGKNAKDESPTLSFREKRAFVFSLSRNAIKAIDNLLGGAREVWQTYNSRLFKKTGDYRAAVKDFESLKPNNVKLQHDAYRVGREGRVADRVVKIRKQGYQNNPTLYVIKAPKNGKGPAKIDMIVYKEKAQRQLEPAIKMEDML